MSSSDHATEKNKVVLLLTLGTHGTLVSIKTTTQNYPLHLKHPGAKMVLLPPAVSSSIILITRPKSTVCLTSQRHARVTAGPKRPHLGVCPGPHIPLQWPQLHDLCLLSPVISA